jgi:hypothetical protein
LINAQPSTETRKTHARADAIRTIDHELARSVKALRM